MGEPNQGAQCAPGTTEKKRCECKTCQYSQQIQALISRQATTADKQLLDDLYSRYADAQEGECFVTGKYEHLVPLRNLIKGLHFLTARERLPGHYACEMCEYLERPL